MFFRVHEILKPGATFVLPPSMLKFALLSEVSPIMISFLSREILKPLKNVANSGASFFASSAIFSERVFASFEAMKEERSLSPSFIPESLE